MAGFGVIGLSGACLYGDCGGLGLHVIEPTYSVDPAGFGGLGADPATPPVVEPAVPTDASGQPLVKTGEEPSAEAATAKGAPPVGQERNRPFYKSPWFLGSVIAAVAAAGGGYIYLRKKRRTTI